MQSLHGSSGGGFQEVEMHVSPADAERYEGQDACGVCVCMLRGGGGRQALLLATMVAAGLQQTMHFR